jgi:hypothetical protein
MIAVPATQEAYVARDTRDDGKESTRDMRRKRSMKIPQGLKVRGNDYETRQKLRPA